MGQDSQEDVGKVENGVYLATEQDAMVEDKKVEKVEQCDDAALRRTRTKAHFASKLGLAVVVDREECRS